MAYKYQYMLKNLNNTQLIEVFQNNQWPFQDVITQRKISGQDISEFSEFDVYKWGLPARDAKALWAIINSLKKTPENFIPNTSISKVPKRLVRPPLSENKNMLLEPSFNQKLEQAISALGSKPEGLSVTDSKPQKPQSLTLMPEYITFPNQQDIVEEAGYLTPTGKLADVEENEYEPPPELDAFPNRKPLLPPRESTDAFLFPKPRDQLDGNATFPRIRKVTLGSTFSIPSQISNDDRHFKDPPYPIHKMLQQRPLPSPPINQPTESENIYSSVPDTQIEIPFDAASSTSLSKSNSSSSLLSSASSERMDTFTNLHKPQNYEDFYREKIPMPPKNFPQIPFNFPNKDSQTDVIGSNNSILNFNDEPFYRNTDRKGCWDLLNGLPNGSFLLRPSRNFFLVISLMYNEKIANFGIEKTKNNTFRLNGDDAMSHEFKSVQHLVEYFMEETISFAKQGIVCETVLKKTLPHDRY